MTISNGINNQNLNQEQIQQREIEAKVKNYTGPEGITTKQLEAGLWYVEHRKLFRKILYGFLILVGAVSWSYTIYGFAYYIFRGMNEDQIMVRDLVAADSIGHDYVFQVSARQLAVGPAEVFISTDKKYDLYARMENDNQKWWAEYDYYFSAAGQETDKTGGYIFPLETKHLMALALDLAETPADARLVIENIRWHRVDQHKIPDWDAYYRSHLDIESADIKFTPSSSSLLSENLGLNQLSFNVTNQTAFNYWNVGFSILIYGGGGLVNVNYYTLSDFMSGEKKSVEISWPGDIGWVDKVEIVPEINIMKDDIYMPIEGGVGQVK